MSPTNRLRASDPRRSRHRFTGQVTAAIMWRRAVTLCAEPSAVFAWLLLDERARQIVQERTATEHSGTRAHRLVDPISVRQPAGGLSRDLSIDVRPGETSRLDVRFTPADLRMSGR